MTTTSITDNGNVQSKIKDFADAIAHAEGWYAPTMAHNRLPLPRRACNPGDLKMGDHGHGVIDGKTIYASESDGWAALDHQVSLMLLGASHQYECGMTIGQVAQHWTGADHPESWAETVARRLGISVDNTLNEYMGAVIEKPKADEATSSEGK